jgi:hypothetical protein
MDTEVRASAARAIQGGRVPRVGARIRVGKVVVLMVVSKVRRWVSSLVALGVVASMLPTGVGASGCVLTGDGDAESPYQVPFATSLALVGVGACGLDAHYLQTGSINMNGVSHTPIGTDSAPFTGTYDGGGWVIRNLEIKDASMDYVGLFGVIDGGTVTGVELANVVLEGGEYAGGIAGNIENATISSVFVEGSITAEERSGGLVGLVAASTIQGSFAFVDVTVTGYEPRAGGLAALVVESAIEDSFAFGTVVSTDEDVEFDDYGAIGGLVGRLVDSGIYRSFAGVSVDAKGGSVVGGLVGESDDSSVIEFSVAVGDVTSEYWAGGLVGRNLYSGITSSYARGAVHATEVAGGLVGVSEGDNAQPAQVITSYSTGEVTAGSGGEVGGLIGDIVGTTEQKASFWDTETSLLTSSAGAEIGKTTAEMTDISTFNDANLDPAWLIETGWKQFDEGTAEWGICAVVNDGYPFLLWGYFGDPCDPGSVVTTPPTTTSPPTTTIPPTTTPPSTTIPPTTVPTVPQPVPTGGVLPTLQPGVSQVLVDGVAVSVEVFVEASTDLVMKGQDFELRLAGECSAGVRSRRCRDGRQVLELEERGLAKVSGEGFLRRHPGVCVAVF